MINNKGKIEKKSLIGNKGLELLNLDKTNCKINFENNSSYDCYIKDKRDNIDLDICEWGYEKCDPGHYWGYGQKKVYIIHFVLNGKGRLLLNNQLYYIGAGEIFLIKPDDRVYYIADEREPWEYKWVSFTGTKVASAVSQSVLARIPCVAAPNMEKYLQYYETIKKTQTEKVYDNLRVIGSLYYLLAQLVEDFPETERKEKTDYKTKEFYLFLNYIYNQIENNFTIAELAKDFGYNRSHLYKIFKKYINMSPKQYITSLQINLACGYINSNQYSLEKVSEKVGFSDYVTFYRNFRNVTGYSPNEYNTDSKDSESIKTIKNLINTISQNI